MKIGIFENKTRINEIKGIYIENRELYKILYSIITKNNNNCNTILIYEPENLFVREKEKEEMIRATNEYDLVFAVTKVRDSVKEVEKIDEDYFVKRNLNRGDFREIQAEAIRGDSLEKLLKNFYMTKNFILFNGNGLKEKVIELI